MKNQKIKLTKDNQIKLLKSMTKALTKELELVGGNNYKLHELNSDLKDQVQYYEKIHKFDRTHIQERDEINKRLQFRIESLQNAIEVLSIAEIRQRNIINDNNHSLAMNEVSIMAPQKGFSIADSRNKEELLTKDYRMGERKIDENEKKEKE